MQPRSPALRRQSLGSLGITSHLTAPLYGVVHRPVIFPVRPSAEGPMKWSIGIPRILGASPLFDPPPPSDSPRRFAFMRKK
ncbi:hypothetical protein LY76DRAFT_334006 [Colletotrichum caudatum]|nr:hypothetical protein LY76DRAFT_334006 [Colletotrichum caudatum]